MKHSPEASEVTLINTCHPWPSTGAPYKARDRQIHDNSNFSDNFSGNISGNISTRKLNTTSRRLPHLVGGGALLELVWTGLLCALPNRSFARAALA
jgi:hypothetical protein